MGVSEEAPRAATLAEPDDDEFEDAVEETSIAAIAAPEGDEVEQMYRRLAADARAWSLDDALRRSADINRTAVEELRAWCGGSGVQPDAPDALLVAFLHCCGGDPEQAKSVLRVYDSVRASAPEVFTDRALSAQDVQRAKRVGYSCMLPKKTPEGFRVLLQRLRDPEPSLFEYAANSKVQYLTMDAAVRADPTAAGYVCVFDMQDVQMAHMWAWGFRLPRKLFKYMQEGLPLRMQRIHFVNSTPIMGRVMRMLRPLMNKGMDQLMHFHTSDDTDRLFEMIPRDCLPENYGGYLPSIEKLQDLTDMFIEEMEPLVQV